MTEVNTMNTLFFTNLQLLGFDLIDMESIYKIPFKQEMFVLPNKAGAEAILHFLFTKLNPVMSVEQFRDCWPILDKSSEHQFRKVCSIWLTQIQSESDSNLPRINASLFLTPGGRKFLQFIYSFSTYVLKRVNCTENGWINKVCYPNVSCNVPMKISLTALNNYSLKEQEQFLDKLHLLIAANRTWNLYSSHLIKEYRKIKKLLREGESDKKIWTKKFQEILQELSCKETSKVVTNKSIIDHSAKNRRERISKVTFYWRQISSLTERWSEDRKIIHSIVDKLSSKYCLDATALGVRIPSILLRESSPIFSKLELDNIYQEGCLNLVSTLLLWNTCLQMYKEHLTRDKLPNLSPLLPTMKTQAHKHMCHLKAAQDLREEVAKKSIPGLGHNVDVLQKKVSHKSGSKSFLRLSLGLVTPNCQPLSSLSGSEKLSPLSSLTTTARQGPVASSFLNSVSHVVHGMHSIQEKHDKLRHKQVISLPKYFKRLQKEVTIPKITKVEKTQINSSIVEPLSQKKVNRNSKKLPEHNLQFEENLLFSALPKVSKQAAEDLLVDRVVQSVFSSMNSSLNESAVFSFRNSLLNDSDPVKELGSISPLRLKQDHNSNQSLTQNLETILSRLRIGDVSHSTVTPALQTEDELVPQDQQCNITTLNSSQSALKMNDLQMFPLAKKIDAAKDSSHEMLNFSNAEEISLLPNDLLYEDSHNSQLDLLPVDSELLQSSLVTNQVDFIQMELSKDDDQLFSVGSLRSHPEATSLQFVQEKLLALRQKASNILDISLDTSASSDSSDKS